MTKIFGIDNLELSEDVVQQTFIDALQIWRLKGLPDNPAAWLFRVAKNKAIDVIRRNKFSTQFDFNDNERALLKSEYTLSTTMDNLWREELVNDDMLRMMFACCHEDISKESQITLILKTLCGFSTAEIAKTFLTTEETVSKRLYRTKEFFRQHKIKLEIPTQADLKIRTDAVLNSIYLLFNEGYNSTQADELIRRDLINESRLLCQLLLENELTRVPEAYALLALICFHSARLESRLSADGAIILLPKQDRSIWNKQLIQVGMDYLEKASYGESISNYHLEAAIAFEHCHATTFDETNWERIIGFYELLCKIAPSPIAELNRIIAVYQLNGPEYALQMLSSIKDNKKLESYYLYHSLLGEIHSKINRNAEATIDYERAMELTHSAVERKMIREKLDDLMS